MPPFLPSAACGRGWDGAPTLQGASMPGTFHLLNDVRPIGG